MAERLCQICRKPLETSEEIEMRTHNECMDNEASIILRIEDIPPYAEDL